MAGMVSYVYDLIYPSPAPLKEISCSAVAVDLWRRELNQYDVKDDLILFESEPGILKTTIPNLPSAIDCAIEKYTHRFGVSLEEWLRLHFFKVFEFHRSHRNDILNDFDDFASDYDGTINYVRTAKRMISCERLRNVEKFKIACMYCFENDVRAIWPSVSEKIDSNQINFNRCPQLFYWICLLRDELHKITEQEGDLVDEMMIDMCPSYNWSSLEYFWNRVNPENRSRKAIDMSMTEKETFVRFFLSKLNEQELDTFLVERGSDLISALLTNSSNKFYLLPTWIYIRNNMNESSFTSLVEELLVTETNYHIAESTSDDEYSEVGNWWSTEDETYLCLEVWRNSPDKLKQSAIKNVLHNHRLFKRQNVQPVEFREVRLLLTMLLDATFEERNAFWHENWHNLIYGTRGEDLHRIMNMCFKNKNDIIKFKQTTLANYEKIRSYCVEMLKKGCFAILDDFLNFCSPETPTRRELKQRLLQSCFLGEDSVFQLLHVCRAKEMNEFIDDAFDTQEQAAEFKNQLTLSPVTGHCLLVSIQSGYFSGLEEFVNIFISNDQVVMQMKKSFVDILKSHLIAGTLWQMNAEYLQNFLVWCLGNEDEVTKFKQSISASEVLHAVMEIIKHEGGFRELARCPLNIEEFLIWYFNSFEEIQEFKKEFNHIFERFSSR